ncbi:branched-chain amino acid aminotransferase [Rothia sp. ZJ932]|uniref:branched-chain amino acid aminotransferase n=1 Tax=Rothia sp. ZJ932 TaxID=2810516 RepID=UPI00196854EC|nr:branched-chain amino acid aminotransferase [Rothia sp. ZJ932]QRZ62321.1 branched-chain amino acid aminotransferase [Rothia sp. ZJ932]
MTASFSLERNPNPASEEARAEIFANPGFGDFFSDHMVSIEWNGDYRTGGEWGEAKVIPYGPLSLDPASSVLHYGQEIFEGLKAYRHADGSVWTFRPEKNAERFNRSARRMALPELPPELFIESIKQLIAVDAQWIPTGEGEAFYLRPFQIATEKFLGVRPTRQARFMVIGSPVGNYFGTPSPVDIWLSTNYSRAAEGGTGFAKCGGNYAGGMVAQIEAENNGCKQVIFTDKNHGHALEELGGMNVFFVFGPENKIVTPELTGTILEGVTRDSILQLARDRGMTVEERRVTLDEWKDGVASRSITEVFACGTAAVIQPIGKLKAKGFEIPNAAGEGTNGEITMAIREELVGIQTGLREDKHGWLTQLI